jgi:DivIVA domain-containing protein
MIKTTDIRSRQFRKILRGYDPVEVKYFLEMLAETIWADGRKT